MKILIGDLDPDSGTISRPKRIGVLRQDHTIFDHMRVMDVVICGNKRLWEAMVEKEKLLALADLTDAQGERLGDLECVVAEEDGYAAESDAAVMLEGLGIESESHERPLSELKGGFKLRVLLAQALFGRPDALLLDEPTNHLDLESIEWLEEFLEGYDGVLVVISHDRHFLNTICTHIADIDYQTIIQYSGNYDDMVRMKAQVRSQVEQASVKKMEKIKQLQDFIPLASAPARAARRPRPAARRSSGCARMRSSGPTSSAPSSALSSTSRAAARCSWCTSSPWATARSASSAASTSRSTAATRSPSSAATAWARPRWWRR